MRGFRAGAVEITRGVVFAVAAERRYSAERYRMRNDQLLISGEIGFLGRINTRDQDSTADTIGTVFDEIVARWIRGRVER